MLQAVIFDMDGLMFDTEGIWAQQWAPALAAFGLEEKPGLADAARGTTGAVAVGVVRSFYGDAADPREVFGEYCRLATERFKEPVPKKPGLDRLLAWLGERGVPCAVASSSSETVVRTNLRNAGIGERFAAVVPGSAVAPHSKPEPHIFLEAACRLGSDPAHTLVLEDSFAGVRAGAAGGFSTVMVPDLLQPTEEIRSLCTAVFGSLDEVCDALEASGCKTPIG